MTGTLLVVPTPIGNLEDITLRAIRVLGEVKLIAAEDTRRTKKLLSHFAITTALTSYHQHNKRQAIERVLKSLQDADVALVSDAGMPSISDPGHELIAAAIEAGIRVEVLPGPSAVTTAVALAAVPSKGFIFLGFPPRRRSDFRAQLRTLQSLPYALVLFEAPSRVRPTLVTAETVLGLRHVVAVRELSKIHEEAIRGTISEVISACDARAPRGEWTLVIGPAAKSEAVGHSEEDMVTELMELCASGARARDAVGLVADQFQVKRSDVYKIWLRVRDQGE